MIHCKKTAEGYQVEVKGSGKDIVKESLRIIQSFFLNIQNSSQEDAEAYKKIVISAVLGLDGFCVFNLPENAIHVDFTAFDGQNRQGGDA